MNAKPVLLFLLRFTLVFVLLMAPWPGWVDGYGEYFRALGRKCLRHPGGGGLAKFTRSPAPSDGLDITIYLTNADMVERGGNAPATWVKIGSRVLGLIPTALLMALILATPVPWWRRARALGWGLVWIHGFIVTAIFLAICRQFQIAQTSLGVFEWSPPGKWIVEWLYQIAVEHIGARLALTVVIWVLVTFTREDWQRWVRVIMAAGEARDKVR